MIDANFNDYVQSDFYRALNYSRLTLAKCSETNHHSRTSSCSYVSYINKYSMSSNNFHLANGVGPANEKIDMILDYFTPFLSVQNASHNSGLLPVGLKYLGKNYLVFERPPAVKNIFYVDQCKSHVPDEYESYQKVFALPIPWQLYFVKFNQDMYVYEVRMFFMKNSINSVDQELYLPPIPNFYTSGMLCPPTMDNMEDVDRYSKDAAGVMHAAYDWVWNSGTNHDLTEACLHLYKQLPIENTIFKYLDEHYLKSYFPKLSIFNQSHYLSPTQVSLILRAWEKSNLKEVCELSWPNISGLSQYYPNNQEHRQSENYYNYLPDFIRSDGEHYSDEDIEIIIEDNQYHVEDYDAWLIDNDLITLDTTPPWDHVYTYSELMPQLINAINNEMGNASATLNIDINKIINSINKMQHNV